MKCAKTFLDRRGETQRYDTEMTERWSWRARAPTAASPPVSAARARRSVIDPNLAIFDDVDQRVGVGAHRQLR